MLVALGFLAAIFFALLVAPAFWRRAVRLTTQRLKDTMPLTEQEIQADKDRLRAEHAITVHRLERGLEQLQLSANRSRIELNRRDARINELEAERESLRGSFEEAQNARNVLEQTILDRLPRVEGRLGEARHLLSTRDKEIGDLARTADQQGRALSEAKAVNAQQQREIERLESALATRAPRIRRGAADAGHDADVSLRAELEALRRRTREQAQMIASLQGRAARSVEGPEAAINGRREAGQPGQVAKLVASAVNGAKPTAPPDLAAEARIRSLQSEVDDQAAEIVRLRASLEVHERAKQTSRSDQALESRIALKARLTAADAENAKLAETVQKLRGELAASNERAARQAAQFADEAKRMGAGTIPVAAEPRRPAEAAPRLSLAERVARARVDAEQHAAELALANRTKRPASGIAAGEGRSSAPVPASGEEAPKASPGGPEATDAASGPVKDAAPAGREDGTSTPRAGSEGGKADASEGPRLLDRISGVGRGS